MKFLKYEIIVHFNILGKLFLGEFSTLNDKELTKIEIMQKTYINIQGGRGGGGLKKPLIFVIN
jgi:hypothetical protein